jgi:hypothetical protein
MERRVNKKTNMVNVSSQSGYLVLLYVEFNDFNQDVCK